MEVVQQNASNSHPSCHHWVNKLTWSVLYQVSARPSHWSDRARVSSLGWCHLHVGHNYKDITVNLEFTHGALFLSAEIRLVSPGQEEMRTVWLPTATVVVVVVIQWLSLVFIIIYHPHKHYSRMDQEEGRMCQTQFPYFTTLSRQIINIIRKTLRL